jgi:ActR/RegA family two-component response regulator
MTRSRRPSLRLSRHSSNNSTRRASDARPPGHLIQSPRRRFFTNEGLFSPEAKTIAVRGGLSRLKIPKDDTATRAKTWCTCLDVGLPDVDGREAVRILRKNGFKAPIIMTGYGNIATAVNAVKLGAVDYLSKPVDADDVVAALLALEGRRAEPPENPMSADRVRWEHIQRIYELCGRNVSETARLLNMHRRTLQRILAKHAPK